MEKFKVNKDACIGCGACMALCPEVFDMDEDGLAKVIKEKELTPEEVENATDAMEGCPTAAISKEEDNA